MDDRTIARNIAGGRVLFGLFMIFLPKVLARFSGDGQAPPQPYVWWLRAFGIRDLVLGAGAFQALGGKDDDAAARWVQMGAVADSLDVVTAVGFRGDMDQRGRISTLAIAAPAAALGWKSWAGLRGTA